MQAVWVSFRSLIVQRDQLDTYWGAKKILFLIRDIDGRAMAAAPVESCQDRGPEVSLGSPRVGTRRGQSPTPHARPLPSVHTYEQGPLRSMALDHDPPKFSIQSSLGSSKYGRMRRRRLPDHRPIPEGVRELIYIRKKCAIWTRWRPVPGKNVNYLRAPSSRRSGLVGPYTTPPIVNYKYRTSTL